MPLIDRILCVEDDLTIYEVIKSTLNQYHVIQAQSLQVAQSELDKNSFVLLILDILLPDGDALEWYQRAKSRPDIKSLPLIVLSGHSDFSRKAQAFSLGADDFVAKPFDPLEFKLRAEAKIRKFKQDHDTSLYRKVGNILVDGKKYSAYLLADGQKDIDLGLTHTELKILSLLTQAEVGAVYSREQILNYVWNGISVADRTVDSHVAHLRNKLLKTNLSLESVKNVGYKIVVK